MNKFLYGFATGLGITIIVGCSSLLNNNNGIFGKSQKAQEKIDQKIRIIENQQSESNEDRLKKIGAWSEGGVEYSLNKITNNVPKEVEVAKQMNERIMALADKPDFTEVKLIKEIVNDLLSQVKDARLEGEKALAQKDKEISKIQDRQKQLDIKRENEIANAFALADVNAKAADQYKATLSQMDSWFGLGAIMYGFKKFAISCMWAIIIFSIIFLILRILASSNPIAAGIFAIFEQVGSWIIHTVSFILPKSISIAGSVSAKALESTKGALKSIVDSVETVKLQSKASGKPATIQDLLNTAELSMNEEDKAIIEKLKMELGWVKLSTKSTVVLNQTTPN